ncbi:MAG: SDR family oxidoreductase [Porticoccaceae bacterium]
MAVSSPRIVVITGASAGVGRAAALAFARRGDRLALIARGKPGLEATAREIGLLGGSAMVIVADVADDHQVREAAKAVEEKLGPIDIWVNNAMVTVFSSASEMSAEEYRRVTEVSYLGAVYGTLAALEYMRPRNRGTVIQVGSALAHRGIPLQSAYCAAKFALRGFTESLRVELMYESSAIHLTMVQLSALNTPQFNWARHRLTGRPQPLPPIFQPEVAASAIVWSSLHKRRELFVGFPALKVILGNKLFPNLVDWYACRQAVDGQVDKSLPAPGAVRPDNLFAPVDCNAGAHGRFDRRARASSAQLLASQYRLPLLGLLALTTVIALSATRAVTTPSLPKPLPARTGTARHLFNWLRGRH